MDHDEGWPDWSGVGDGAGEGPTDDLSGTDPAGYGPADDFGADGGFDAADAGELAGADAHFGADDAAGGADLTEDAGYGTDEPDGDAPQPADAAHATPESEQPDEHAAPDDHAPPADGESDDQGSDDVHTPDDDQPDAADEPDTDHTPDADPAPDADHEPGGEPDDFEVGHDSAADAFGAGLDSTGDPASSWHADEFPAEIDLGADAPEPHDGYPWSDPDTLGHPDPADVIDDPAAGSTPVEPQDLLEYAGLDSSASGNPWTLLLGSDDPATSALARWWGPAAA